MNSTASRKRFRSSGTSTFPLSPKLPSRVWNLLRRKDVLVRLGLCLAAVTATWAATQAWRPPFPYHVGYVPPRNITARVGFKIDDPNAIGMNTDKFIVFEQGEAIGKADQPLKIETLEVLRQEQQAFIDLQLTPRKLVERSLAVFAMILGIYALCGYYIYGHERRIIADLRRYATLLVVTVTIVMVGRATSVDPWRAELIPLLLFAMTIGIAYGRAMAMVLSLAVALILTVTTGGGLAELLLLLGVIAATVVQLGRIRGRRKLIKVGFYASLVAPLLTIGIGMLYGQPLAISLLTDAWHQSLWAFLAGFLTTGLLPFIESFFGALTEISLLELGDVAHPLLQELVRRAPGTYNHSINVASIAEAAAESVGGRGLLVRVGAYFHDIGKMLKPHYFVENQGSEASRHDSLVPAMSTLIIIAHIKDGADLARQHHLPEPIIDMIEQHHGTTLVEYFYRRANEQSEANPDLGHVEESSFRYPGPKPQTIEAAVLMLADAVESASRVLVEPTPARIESLVEDIAMKKLLDGQFDECSLTLKQLRTIEDSLIKSLTAVYHGRVKYPDQRTA
jgi:putative nucleotidyltransferase with HDIG domain